MTINGVKNIPGRDPPGGNKKAEPDKPCQAKVTPEDRVDLNKKGDQPPNLIVGAPTGRLAPLAYPINVHPNPIAIEITNGVGIGIDGESIIVAPGREGEIDVIGHLEDGTYPQRDYKVTRRESKTTIDGLYDWQDYEITGNANKMHIQGQTPRETIDVTKNGSRISVRGAYPVQNYEVVSHGNETFVDGWESIEDAHLETVGNKTTITGGFPERNFVVTRDKNHMKVDGKYAFQDFDITWDDKQILITSCYPHQTHVVKFKNSKS